MRPLVRAGRPIVCLAALAAVPVPPAQANVWMAPTTLSGPAAHDPVVAVNSRGDAAAAWLLDQAGSTVVQVRLRAAGGAWGPVQTMLSPDGPSQSPVIALNDAGNAVLAWDEGSGVAAYAQRSPGGVFGPRSTAGSASNDSTQPAVGLDSAGNATIVTVDQNTPSGGWLARVQATTVAANGTVSAQTALWTDSNSSMQGLVPSGPAVAVDGRGEAVATWQTSANGMFNVLGALRPLTGGSLAGGWKTYEIIGPGSSSSGIPQVAIDPLGRFVLALDSGSPPTVQALVGSTSTDFGAPDYLSPTGSGAPWAIHPQTAIDANGNGTVVWVSYDGTTSALWVSARTIAADGSKGAFGPALSGNDTNSNGPPMDPHVSVNGRGDAIAVWDIPGPTQEFVIQSALRSAGGSFGAAQTISDPVGNSDQPRIGIDAAGDGVAVFQHVQGGSNVIQAALFAQPSSSGGSNTGGGTGSGAGTNGSGAPVLTQLRLDPAAFAAASSGPTLARRRRTGTQISYSDSRAATATFAVLRTARGVVGPAGRCVRRSRRRHPRRCTRYVRVAGFTHRDIASVNRLHFSGRVNGHKLAPGRYTLTGVAAAGGKSGAAVSAAFRIIR